MIENHKLTLLLINKSIKMRNNIKKLYLFIHLLIGNKIPSNYYCNRLTELRERGTKAEILLISMHACKHKNKRS